MSQAPYGSYFAIRYQRSLFYKAIVYRSSYLLQIAILWHQSSTLSAIYVHILYNMADLTLFTALLCVLSGLCS